MGVNPMSYRLLDDELRVRDPDRWLSSRFVADPLKRARLVALYTLDGEWARVAAAVTSPLAGEIRLAWWSEALEEFASGGPGEHPAFLALGRDEASALRTLLVQTIDARLVALHDPPAGDEAKFTLMLAAARLLDPSSPEAPVRHAALALPAAPEGLAAANRSLRSLSVSAFPAVAHATLARAYAKGGQPSALEKRLRITWAMASGRL